MYKELSLAILDRLNVAGIRTNEISFQEILDGQIGALERPVVNISINNSTFDKVTLQKYKSNLTVTLILIVQNVRGEKERRFAIYDLIEEIINYLILQDFGIAELQDHLRPTGFTNVTDKAFSDAGYQLYQITFLASFIFTYQNDSDEDLGRLNTIVNDYFLLHPDDDGVRDTTGTVTFNTIFGGSAWSIHSYNYYYGGKAGSKSYVQDNLYGGKASSTYA